MVLWKTYNAINDGILRCRGRLSSSKDWAGFLIGVIFIGFALSVGTWHWWLEHKVGLYAWIFIALTTCVLSLVTPDRDTTISVLVFGSSYVSVARFWDWLHSGMPGYIPLLWTFGTVFLVGITPKWKLTALVALGMWAVLSLKAVLLDGEPRALIITAIAIALASGILLTARDPTANERADPQMTSLAYTKSSTTLLGLNYYYAYDGTNCPTGASGNNGQIQCVGDATSTPAAGRSAKYSYDELGRLSTASTSGTSTYPQWGLSWTYDRYGNRTAQSVTAGSAMSDSLSISTSTNQVTGSGYSYDANGNMLGDGVNTMTYDAENRMVTSSNGSSSGAYVYDGNGLRVKKCVPNCSSPTTTTRYIFSGSKVIAEYDNGAAATSPSREYLYAGGMKVATLVSSTPTYHLRDHLSVRVNTDSSGSIIGEQGHYPFGDSWYLNSTTTKEQFTTYERDAESGNDYAMARYHVNRLGRFSLIDPLSGSLGNPQSLNHYAYALNDPINGADPSGRSSCDSPNPPVSCSAASETDEGGGSCTLDGISTDCGIMGFGGGDAVQCPNNVCEGYNGNSQWVYYAATETGGAYYNSNYGPGAMFYSWIAAGTAAGEYANPASIANNWEYSGNVYVDSNGFYSFTPPVTRQSLDSSPYEPNEVPYGTAAVATYHTHGADVPGYFSEYFSWPSTRPGTSLYPTSNLGPGGDIGISNRSGLPIFVATPGARQEVYFPSMGMALPFGCVLVGGAVPPGIPSGTTTYMPGVPTCH